MRQRSTTINVLFPQWVKFIIILWNILWQGCLMALLLFIAIKVPFMLPSSMLWPYAIYEWDIVDTHPTPTPLPDKMVAKLQALTISAISSMKGG